MHNLPKCSGSGVYELGVAVSRTGVGRDIGKLHPDRIVVAYLGQADNVRTRLQQYGRTGAHLGNSYYSNDSKSVPLQRRPGLFEEILSKGYPIVFRWVPVSTSLLVLLLLSMVLHFVGMKRALLGREKIDKARLK